MNNEQKQQHLELYKAKLDTTEYQRQLFTWRAEIAARANYSGVEDFNQTQEVTNNNQFNLGKLATKKAMIAQFIGATHL